MSLNDEYFIHGRAANDSNPLIGGADGEKRKRLFYAPSGEVDLELFDGDPLRLKLRTPVPKKPVMVDFHKAPEPVVLQKIYDVLVPLNLFKVQFIPAVVDVKGKAFPYWFLHNFNRIACVDEKRSQVKFSKSHDYLIHIDRLVLSEEILTKIPLAERLYFVLKEQSSMYFMHQSIKDAVLAAAPEGIRFWPVTKWSESSAFEE